MTSRLWLLVADVAERLFGWDSRVHRWAFQHACDAVRYDEIEPDTEETDAPF